MPDKTLVTGATGLLGSELVRQLVNRGDDVRILRRGSSKLDLLGDAAPLVEHALGDVTEPLDVEDAMRDVQYVYHVAAKIGYGLPREEAEIMRVNVRGTAIVVDAAVHAGVKRMVHTSSVAALGKPESPDGLITEDSEWVESSVNSAYGRSKRLAELEVFRGISEGLDAVIVNPSIIFGTGRAGENTREVIELVRKRRLPGVPKGGNMVVDVIDTVAGHLLAMESGATAERYILGSENLTWKQIIDTIADVFGVAPPRFMVPPVLGVALAAAIEVSAAVIGFRPLISRSNIRQSARTYRYDNSKAVSKLGCTFRPFRQTVERIAGDVLAQRTGHATPVA